jgi:competence protein ComEA
MSLPGIGEKTAEKIISKRIELGRFNSEEDIMLVPGIGIKTFEKLSPHIIIK